MANVTIQEALSKLDVNNDNHWTSDGLPKVDTVKMLTGNPALTREQITQADPQFNRESLRTSTENNDADKAPESPASPTGAAQGNGAGTGSDQGDAVAPSAAQGLATVNTNPAGNLPVVKNEEGGQAALSADKDGNLIAIGQSEQTSIQPHIANTAATTPTIDAPSQPLEGDTLASVDGEIQKLDAQIITLQNQKKGLLDRRYAVAAKMESENSSSVAHASTVRGYLQAQVKEAEAQAERRQKLIDAGLL